MGVLYYEINTELFDVVSSMESLPPLAIGSELHNEQFVYYCGLKAGRYCGAWNDGGP